MARAVLARGVNVIAQLVARRTLDGQMQLSLGSNPDVTADLLPQIAAARRAGRDIVLVGQTHGADAVHGRTCPGGSRAVRFPH